MSEFFDKVQQKELEGDVVGVLEGVGHGRSNVLLDEGGLH